LNGQQNPSNKTVQDLIAQSAPTWQIVGLGPLSIHDHTATLSNCAPDDKPKKPQAGCSTDGGPAGAGSP
jgi:hypothetical protein